MSDRSNPYKALFFVVVLLWGGWQGSLNLARWAAIVGNLRSLGPVLNQNEGQFRREFLTATKWAEVKERDVQIGRSVVTVKSRWTLEVPWVRTFEWPMEQRYEVPKRSMPL